MKKQVVLGWGVGMLLLAMVLFLPSIINNYSVFNKTEQIENSIGGSKNEATVSDQSDLGKTDQVESYIKGDTRIIVFRESDVETIFVKI